MGIKLNVEKINRNAVLINCNASQCKIERKYLLYLVGNTPKRLPMVPSLILWDLLLTTFGSVMIVEYFNKVIRKIKWENDENVDEKDELGIETRIQLEI